MTKADLPKVDEVNEILQYLYSDEFRDNPLLFVMYAFPWGKEGGPLAEQMGPRDWQRETLLEIAEHIKKNKEKKARGEMPSVYKLAVASGRGIGKSALVSWIILWMMSCHRGSTTIISANTDAQITDKTFGEVSLWLARSINRFCFEMTQKSIKPAQWYKELLFKEMNEGVEYYYANGVLWNEDNVDGFAGAHSSIGMSVIFDEASGIPEPIWRVTKGFFTDNTLYRFWFAFSNPRAGAGPFFDCFNDEHSGWNTRKINSLDVKEINPEESLDIVRKHGADSDEARVEVYGEFPKQGDRQFISRAVVYEATKRELIGYDKSEPLLMGVDPARFGDDPTVIRFRSGRDGRSIPALELRGLDNMQVVDRIIQLIYAHKPDAIFIDSGAGAGIIDRMRQLGYKVFEVQFGSSPSDFHYFDHRTELWARMAEWLQGGMIDTDAKLIQDLTIPEKEFIGRESKIKLESKEKMRTRGYRSSTDHGDALALTFHAKISKPDLVTAKHRGPKKYKGWSKPLLD